MITVAVLYNVFFVIARSVFWVMTSKVWMVFDYTADVIYLVDLFVRCQRIPDTSVMLETFRKEKSPNRFKFSIFCTGCTRLTLNRVSL